MGKIIEIDLDKLDACVGNPYNFDNANDPIKNMIEERCGKIIKVIQIVDGNYVTIYEKK